MKPSITLISAALLAVASAGAVAASSVDLSVQGVITPAACTPALSSGGLVEHGKISVQDLHPSGDTQLSEARLQLSIVCEASTLMAIKGTDNRPGTSPEWDGALSNFGLGLATGDKKIGWYTLTLANGLADETPRGMIESFDGRTWTYAGETTIWQPNWMRTFNAASDTNPAPLPVQSFKADVVIATTLTSKQNLPVTEDIIIDGSATLDVIYL